MSLFIHDIFSCPKACFVWNYIYAVFLSISVTWHIFLHSFNLPVLLYSNVLHVSSTQYFFYPFWQSYLLVIRPLMFKVITDIELISTVAVSLLLLSIVCFCSFFFIFYSFLPLWFLVSFYILKISLKLW